MCDIFDFVAMNNAWDNARNACGIKRKFLLPVRPASALYSKKPESARDYYE